jgi:hypothetical protein
MYSPWRNYRRPIQSRLCLILLRTPCIGGLLSVGGRGRGIAPYFSADSCLVIKQTRLCIGLLFSSILYSLGQLCMMANLPTPKPNSCAVEVSLGIILRILRLEVSVYNVYCTLQTSFKLLLLQGGGKESKIR